MTQLLFSLTVLLIFSLPVTVFAASVDAQISSQGDTTHLEFSGLNQWDYDIQKKEQKDKTIVELSVPAFSENGVQALEAFRSSEIQSIKVNRKGPDGKYLITIQMKGSKSEYFDYLTDQPSRLIVDMYRTKSSDRAENSAEPAESAAEPQTKSSDKKTVAKSTPAGQRKPATADILVINNGTDPGSVDAKADGKVRGGIFDGADPEFSRFSVQDFEVKEDSIISSRENIYLQFPILRVPSPDLENINAHKPIYEIAPADTEENKQARLLLTLFNNKRYNVFLKTVEWFNSKFPNSKYDEIVKFMWADAHFNLWLEKRDVSEFDMAILRYRQALESYPKTALAERTQLLMGYANLDRGDYLGTLRQFQSYLRNRPQSAYRDRARLGVAEAFLKLNREDDAINQYREIEKDGSLEASRVEAAYLIGDLYFIKKEYQNSINEYQNALKKYPQGKNLYPNAAYNQAAASFELKDYRKSLDLYREFLKKFPSHEYSGYAMTRVGELLDILGADKTRVVGAYLETYFRYGNSPSAIVARLRLLSSRMKGMKAKEVEKAVHDINELTKKSELQGIEQFAALMIAEGYNKRFEYDKAIDLLVKYYQANPIDSDTKLLQQRIVKNINDKISDYVNSGNFIQALQTHNKYADSWLKSSQRLDTRFNLARAFEQAGVQNEAEALYKYTLNNLYAIKGTSAEKEKSVIEKLPSEDRMNLRLAMTTAAQSKFNAAYDYLKNIKKPDQLAEVEQIERVQLAATLLEKKGDLDSASRYLVDLIKTWRGLPELVAEPYLQLAEVETKQGKFEDALKSFDKVNEMMEDSGKVSPQTHAKALEKSALLQLQQGKQAEASATIEKLLKTYEKDRPLASLRYKLGQIYFDRGEVQKAAETWNNLKGTENDFWYKISQEKLKNAEWNDGYKKYLKRIPAMAEKGESK